MPLFLACFLTLGHSMFPHTHQKISGDEFVFGLDILDNENSLFSLLSAVFSQDLGCNHLENYHKTHHELPPFVFAVQAFLHTFLEFKLVSEDESPSFYVHSTPKLFTELILKDTPLRAPPRI